MAKMIVSVICVDMDEKVMDVVGVMHLVAENAQDATEKAAKGFTAQGITKEGGKYHFQMVVLAPLPGEVQIAKPQIQLPKGVVLSGSR